MECLGGEHLLASGDKSGWRTFILLDAGKMVMMMDDEWRGGRWN